MQLDTIGSGLVLSGEDGEGDVVARACVVDSVGADVIDAVGIDVVGRAGSRRCRHEHRLAELQSDRAKLRCRTGGGR